MVDLCIFPIPGCVTFPGTVFPLHVFEPRYRSMMYHCLEHKQPVAICHTRSLLSEGKDHASLQESLNANQATYRPYDVVSAGLCELKEITADGRLLIYVHIDQRYRIIKQTQMLPYQVFQAEVFPDCKDDDHQQRDNALLKEKILHRLEVIGHDLEGVQEVLQSEQWQQKSAERFSFELFGLIRFDADLMQQILEMNSVRQRLNFTLDLLNQ